MNDIDLSAYDNWEPIGNIEDPNKITGFLGILNGNEHVIKNLKINNMEALFCVGLFGSLTGEVKNLKLENVDVNAPQAGFTGGLVGINWTNISNCSVSGKVMGDDCVGGICGVSNGSITNCLGDVEVNGDGNIGGLVGGLCWGGKMSNCISYGSVTGNENVGEVVGWLDERSYIENCFWVSELPDQSNGIGLDEGTSNNNSGLTQEEASNPDNFINAGWDEDVWDFSQGTPTLKPLNKTPSPNKPASGSGSLRLQVGADSDSSSCIHADTSFALGDFGVDFSTAESCAAAIDDIDALLNTINKKQADFGAVLNRLDSVLSSQVSTIENLTASKSTIMDADIAQESADYVKSQILQQTTSALLVQAQGAQSSVIMALIG